MTMPWSNQAISVIVLSGPSGVVVGVFAYAPGTTPAFGNSPIDWLTESSTDPFGNPVTPGVGASEVILGGGTLSTPATRTLQIACGHLLTQAGAVTQWAPQALPASGGLVTSDTILAWDPSQTLHTVSETWHTVSLAAGWSTVAGRPVPSYRYLPDGNVQLVGTASHASFSGITTITGTALPAAYRPATNQVVPITDLGIATGENNGEVIITTAGVLETGSRTPTGSTLIDFTGIYPLNL